MSSLLEDARENQAAVTRVALGTALLPKAAKEALIEQARLVVALARELERMKLFADRCEDR